MLTPAFHIEAITTTILSAARGSRRCVTCGTIKKSGKRSCCARGGAWFKNCGDAGDTKFDHTWAEGIRACKGFGSSLPVESPPHAMLPCIYPINTTMQPNTTWQHTNIYHVGNISNAGATKSEESAELENVAVRLCGLFLFSNLYV